MAIETPAYDVLSKTGNVEIRRYDTYLQAVVVMEGARRDSLYRGFRVLADYIFGNNRSSTKVAMTAPVGQASSSEKIAMTAPVGAAAGEGGTWRITFTMPRAFTEETLPRPNDPRVVIERVPPKKIAAWRFSGWATEGRVEDNRRAFLEEMKAQGLSPRGALQLAQYDVPWALPFFRRNEWLVEVP